MTLLLLRRKLLLTSKTAAIIAPNRLLRAALRRFSSGVSPTVCDPYQHCRNCLPGVDEVTLVAGDGDYVPIAEHLIERGLKFDVAFWDHANHELKKACSKFISLRPKLPDQVVLAVESLCNLLSLSLNGRTLRGMEVPARRNRRIPKS